MTDEKAQLEPSLSVFSQLKNKFPDMNSEIS